jgi:hypothetical protein
MSEYLLLIAEQESGYENGGQEVFDKVMAGHNAVSEKWGDKVKGGNALQPTATATVVRGYGTDSFTVTDGPFVESKEALGGYYLVEAADLDEAIEMAKDVPAYFGVIEVRPVMVFE